MQSLILWLVVFSMGMDVGATTCFSWIMSQWDHTMDMCGYNQSQADNQLVEDEYTGFNMTAWALRMQPSNISTHDNYDPESFAMACSTECRWVWHAV